MKTFVLPDIQLPDNIELLGKIDCGGAGSVFRVKDITGKILALKIVNRSWGENELNSLTALRDLPSHPALTQIFQAGKLPDGRLFYTMEIADNISAFPDKSYTPDTLANKIREADLAFDDILKIFTDVAKGLKHLHDHGCAHGDIKPENIIFINGKAKLADFGTLSSDGSCGTAGFAVENPVSDADRDCYALAKTLYCAWSGKDVSEYPALPIPCAPKEARLIRKIYIKGCSDTPRKRFSSADAFIDSLKKAELEFHRTQPKKSLLISLILLFSTMLLIAAAFLVKHANSERAKLKKQRIEISLMQNIIRASGEMPDDLSGITPFRSIFESLDRDDLNKDDTQTALWFQQFYQDIDRLKELHSKISAEKDLSARLKLYRESHFKELFVSVHSRRMDFDHNFVRRVLKSKADDRNKQRQR